MANHPTCGSILELLNRTKEALRGNLKATVVSYDLAENRCFGFALFDEKGDRISLETVSAAGVKRSMAPEEIRRSGLPPKLMDRFPQAAYRTELAAALTRGEDPVKAP